MALASVVHFGCACSVTATFIKQKDLCTKNNRFPDRPPSIELAPMLSFIWRDSVGVKVTMVTQVVTLGTGAYLVWGTRAKQK